MTSSIFIGSSSEALCYAESMRDIINRTREYRAVTWKDHFADSAGTEFTIAVLKKIVETFRIGIFFITNDDQIVIRKKKHYTARTNVWFEIGMFAARYGQENAIVLVEEDDLSGANIPTDYLGVGFPTFNISKNAKRAIKDAWQKGKTLSSRASRELRKALERCFNDKIKKILNKRFGSPAEFTINIADRKGCYEKAKEMIEGAKRIIFTVVSYEEELTDPSYPRGLLPFLEKKIDQMKKKKPGASSLGGFEIKRWMNLGAKEIQDQAFQILRSKYAKHIEVKDTYCHFIEAVVTEDKVLLPLPQPRGRRTWVGQGIYIESDQIARFFADWFENKLPEPNGVRLTKEGLSDYLSRMEIRNSGNRTNRCHACAATMPGKIREALRKKFPSSLT